MIDYFKIPGHPDYVINKDGDIINTKTWTHISSSIVGGRRRVCLDGCTEYMANLLLTTFDRPKEKTECVIYRDGNTHNDLLHNVEWGRRGQNYSKKYPTSDLYPGREAIPKPIMINELSMSFDSIRQCAEFINGSPSGIRQCLSGSLKTYRGYTFTLI